MIRTGGGRFDPAESQLYFLAIGTSSQQSFTPEELSMIKTGGDRFDPAGENIYFLASNVDRMRNAALAHDNLLIAVNELKTASGIEHLEAWMRAGKNMFIDSGIFNLTNEHARAHPGVTMDEALALAPERIDGFDGLFKRYCEIIDQYGRDSWGYIELDQGGRENKIRTRQRLEALGFRPIPVYHPFNDGWDYFDYLAENYDRICFGNVVQATVATRLRLVATAWERHRKYPNLWIHLLGMTPNRFLYALPINSADSSAWLSSVRWSGYKPSVMGQPVGDLPKGFQYQLGSVQDSEVGSRKAATMAAYGAHCMQENWRSHLASMRELGFELYPS